MVISCLAGTALAQPEQDYRRLVDQYCVACHNQQIVNAAPDQITDPLASQLRVLGLALDTLDLGAVADAAEHWEKVVRKLRAGLMPPAGMPRPETATLDGFRAWLETELDNATTAAPNPGRTATFHRLNRAEYSNAIRDLLALEINANDFLPADDGSYGFDNIGGVLRMSQSLMERYLEASRVISRMAVGSPPPVPFSETFRTQQDEQQHERIEGLPFGTRGGILVDYLFPQNADYELRIQLSGLRGIEQPHELEVTVDGVPVQTNLLSDKSTLDLTVPIDAGPRTVGVAFKRKPQPLVEQVRERFQNPRTAGNSGGPFGPMPFVGSLTIAGPYNSQGAGNTPSRDRIFSCNPANDDQELDCADEILSSLARKSLPSPRLPNPTRTFFSTSTGRVVPMETSKTVSNSPCVGCWSVRNFWCV